jgi:hypothetical protein
MALPRSEIVREYLVPEIDDFLRFGEEAMAADFEQQVAMTSGTADTTQIVRIFSRSR